MYAEVRNIRKAVVVAVTAGTDGGRLCGRRLRRLAEESAASTKGPTGGCECGVVRRNVREETRRRGRGVTGMRGCCVTVVVRTKSAGVDVGSLNLGGLRRRREAGGCQGRARRGKGRRKPEFVK